MIKHVTHFCFVTIFMVHLDFGLVFNFQRPNFFFPVDRSSFCVIIVRNRKFSIQMMHPSFKGQLISKCLFDIFNSPKKWTKNLTLILRYLKLNCFKSFFGRIEDTIRHFEINWPLNGDNIISCKKNLRK